MSTLQQVNGHEGQKESGIHLFVGGTHSEATINIRWCVCREKFDALLEKGVKKPYILLAIARAVPGTEQWEEVDRRVMPLGQVMEIIQFRRPGRHKVFATIIWFHDDKYIDRAKNYLFNKVSATEYRHDLLNACATSFQDFIFYINNMGEEMIEVTVEEDFFAKEPSQWLWNWVNLWHETRPRDQCQFRKRCILAFSIQPIVMFFWELIICPIRFTSALFLAVGLGIRKISFKPIFHPISMKTSDVWSEGGDSVFIRNKSGKRRPFSLLFFMPIFPLLTLLAHLYFLFFSPTDIWHFLVRVMVSYGALLVFALVTDFSVRVFNKVFEWKFKKLKARWAEQRRLWKIQWQEDQEKKERAKIERTYSEMSEPLVCQGKPMEATLAALPKRNRTLHLRFWDLKAKVCKPFAR